MKLKNLALAVGTAAAFCVSSAHAVPFAPNETLVMTSGSDFIRNQDYGIQNPWYYELVNGTLSNLLAKVELLDTTPDDESIGYRVLVDTVVAPGLIDTNGALVASGTLTDEAPNPFFTFLMNTGTQYVLELTGLGKTAFSQTEISAVPLPGAIWLFGSALLGFLGFSNRRKV